MYSMSLFPAYTGDNELKHVDSGMEVWEAALESELLASDEERPPAPPPPGPAPSPGPPAPWYEDRVADGGNLRVSTLYYPGRPQYRAGGRHAALGGRPRRAHSPRRAARYYTAPPPPAPSHAEEVEARGRELRADLAAAPRVEERALHYLAWCTAWLAPDPALEAARVAVAHCSTRRTRDALAAARRRALPPDGVLGELRAELATARGAVHRAETWARLVEAGGAAHCVRLATAALDALPAASYPRVLHACGCALRAGGLSERVVQLVELTAAMNFPRTPIFPPPLDPHKAAAIERDLADKEDKAISSGLPVGTVWVRVERLRGAARWRAGAGGADDPQRRPVPTDLGGVLRAAAPRDALALLGALLRLARVPPLPSAGWTRRALPAAPDGGEWLAALLLAARRLPPAHRPATPAALRRHLAQLLDPPHYFSDSTGYLSWVVALWEAGCSWLDAGSAERAALLAWRLRWLDMLAAQADPAEARRLRGEGRAALRRLAPRDPHHHALLARLEARADGAERGARAAIRAARAAHAAPRPVALHAARVVAELCPAHHARHALLAAVLHRPLPPDALLDEPPSRADLAAAEDECVRRCAELERRWEREEEELGEEEGDPEAAGEVCAALLPGDGEWVAARVALAEPAERARLERAARAGRAWRGGAAARYAEQRAVALTLAAAAEGRLTAVAGALLPRHPDAALLALCAAGAPAWAPPVRWPASDAAWLARVAAALARGAEGVAARACAQGAACGVGGAALACVALTYAHGSERAALRAAAEWPHHKWVSVRAAAVSPPLATSLADALLELELRVHALFEELTLSTHT